MQQHSPHVQGTVIIIIIIIIIISDIQVWSLLMPMLFVQPIPTLQPRHAHPRVATQQQ